MRMRVPMNGRVPMSPAGSGIKPSFSIDFFNTPSVNAPRGGAPSVNTRATIATVTDQDSVVRQVLSGENRFGGFRRVQNFLTFTEDFSNAAWASLTGGTGVAITKTPNYGTAPDGSLTACRLQCDRGAGNTTSDFSFMRQSQARSALKQNTVWMKSNTGATQNVVINVSSFAVAVTTTWRPYSVTKDTGATPFDIGAQGTLTSQTIDILVWHPSQCDHDFCPGAYLSVGVLSAPYQGANVDGVQYLQYTKPEIAFWGDSLTANKYPSMVYDSYLYAGNNYIWCYNGGVSSETSTQIATRMLAQKLRYSDITVIWAGRNNFTAPATVKADIASMIAALGHTRYVVLSILNSNVAAEWSGGGDYTTITTLNNDLAVLYPSNYIDIRALLVAQYNPSDSQDVIDFGHDVPPTSLRVDNLHLNTAGYTYVAGIVKAFIDANWPAFTVGNLISPSIRGGFLPEPAATDLLTARADARDMTTANWTLGATMTRARTSVGADGVANKATRLTGGAVAATNIITTTITAAASSRTYSVLIKRVTGTGPVRITQDNFATSTDISSLINSSTYTLVQINQSQLNAQLGIKVDTNLDAIDADWNQFSAGDLTGLINSRIPDTITTRNADVLSYNTTGWLNATSGTLYAEWFNPNLSANGVIAMLNDNTANNFVRLLCSLITTVNADTVSGGVTQAGLAAASITGAAVAKAVSIYQTNDFAGYANNASLGTDVSGTIPTVNQLQIGSQLGTIQLGHYIRKVAYYPTRLPNSVAQALTV